MSRTRIKLEVYVDLDPMPGTFHSKESARNCVASVLNDRIEHYNPMVSLGRTEVPEELITAVKRAELKNTAAILKVKLDRIEPAGDTLMLLLSQIEGI